MACASYDIPDVEFYKELPFSGRGFGVHTVSPKTRIIPKEDFEKMKPFLLCVGPQGYAEIKKAWYKGCIYAQDKGQCSSQVDTFDDWVKSLDGIFKNYMQRTSK